jgi:hypothetical protein
MREDRGGPRAMSKIVAAIAFAILAFMTVRAQAVPLTVTDGMVFSDGFAIGSSALFRGDGFSAFGEESGVFSEGGPLFGIGLDVTIVGGSTCFDRSMEGLCGQISLTNPPLGPPPVEGVPFTVSAPFTATGDLFEGSFVGQGIVTATWCADPSICSSAPIVLYRFTVAEPPSALLVVAGAFAIAGLIIVRKAHRSELRNLFSR